MRLRLTVTGPRSRALLAALGVLAALLPIWWAADHWFLDWEANTHRQHVESQLSPYADRIASSVRLRLGLLHALGDLVALKATDLALQPEDIEDIDYLIAQTIGYTGGMRDFALAPGGVWSHVYPLLGTESALSSGRLLNEHPEVRVDVQRAILTRRATMSGPWSLWGDDLTLVGWQPVYEQGAYWGLVAVEMDLRAILNEESDYPPGLDVAVRDGRGRVFYGSSAVFESQPVIESVVLPGEYWDVASVPTGGWGAEAGQEDAALRLGGLIIVGLLASLAYLSVGRESLLAAAVEERTRQLSRADDELKAAYQTLEGRVAARTRQLSTIYEVTALASASHDLELTLKRSLERTVSMVGGDVGTIQLLDGVGTLRLAASRGLPSRVRRRLSVVPGGQGLAGRVVAHNDVLMVSDISADPNGDPVLWELGPLACTGIPIRARGRTSGVLTVICASDHLFSKEEVALLVAIGGQIGVAVESARLLADTQGKAVLEERQRLARDLHDSVAQLLYSLTLMAAASRRLIAEGNLQRADEALGRLGQNAQQALKEMRLLVYELRPLALENKGISGALQERLDAVEKRVGVDAELRVDGEIELLAPVEEELYRIAQEALNNALKHAAATSVTVRLRGDQSGITMEIEDNGKGFYPSPDGGGPGLGLVSIRERADRLGASVTIRSMPGAGTAVIVSLESSSASLLVSPPAPRAMAA